MHIHFIHIDMILDNVDMLFLETQHSFPYNVVVLTTILPDLTTAPTPNILHIFP